MPPLFGDSRMGSSAWKRPRCGLISETGRSPWMEVPSLRGGRGIASPVPDRAWGRAPGKGHSAVSPPLFREAEWGRCPEGAEGVSARPGEAHGWRCPEGAEGAKHHLAPSPRPCYTQQKPWMEVPSLRGGRGNAFPVPQSGMGEVGPAFARQMLAVVEGAPPVFVSRRGWAHKILWPGKFSLPQQKNLENSQKSLEILAFLCYSKYGKYVGSLGA